MIYGPPGTQDPAGTPITGPNGSVPFLVLNDGAAATSNCKIDAGEARSVIEPVRDVRWGVALATARAPGDPGVGRVRAAAGERRHHAHAREQAVPWFMFRPDGVPGALRGRARHLRGDRHHRARRRGASTSPTARATTPWCCRRWAACACTSGIPRRGRGRHDAPQAQAAPGFTLLEIMIALSLLGIGLLSLAAMQLTAMQYGSRGRHLTKAAAVAEARMEILMRQTLGPTSTPTALDRARRS